MSSIFAHVFQKLKTDKVKTLFRQSWQVCWPMTMIMFFVSLLGLTDVFVAGKFGKEAQAAYGLAFQLYFTFGIIGTALSVGSVSVVSRLFTSGKKEALTEAVNTSYTLALASGLLLAVIGLLLSPKIIAALSIPSELKKLAAPISVIYSGGLAFNYILLNSNGLLRACTMIRTSLLTMFFVCVANIVLIFWLAFFTPLGFNGIAWATVISTFLGCALNSLSLRRLMSGKLKLLPATAKKILSIGWPAGLLQILWQLGAMALFLILSALPEHTVEILAAFTNGLRIESAIFLPAFAFNMANAVVVGNLLGKDERRDAFNGGIITAAMGVAIVAFMTAVVILNAPMFASLLSRNGTVVKESIKYLYISFLSEPFMAWGIILAGGLNGAGDTKSVMAAIAISIWLVRIPLSYLLGIHWGFGAAAVWWSMNISILVQSALITRRYFSKKWLV